MKRQVSFILMLSMLIMLFSSVSIVQASKYSPIALGAGISGLPMVGQILTGTYYYYGGSSNENTTTTGTSFRWLRSDSSDANGSYTPISNATGKIYILTSADEGFFIKFEVTPRDNAVPNTVGNTITSTPVFVLRVADNYTGNALVSVSSEQTLNSSGNINDDNFSTSWSPKTNNSGENIVLDFGSGNTKSFNTIVLKDNSLVTKYSLQYATEEAPGNWITISNAFDYAGNAHPINFPTVTGRYLKLSIDSCLGIANVYELQVYNVNAYSSNLALYKPVFTNSSNGTNYDFAVNDGAPKDAGYSPASGALNNFWVQIDLGASMTFNKVVGYDNSKINAYRIQVSDDAATWSDVFVSDFISDYGRSMFFDSVKKRFVRLYVDSSFSGVAIKEIQVYNDMTSRSNLALNCATKVSSAYGTSPNYTDYYSFFAVNGVDDQCWQAAATPTTDSNAEWIQLDFCSSKMFDQIIVSQFAAFSNGVTSYKMQYSNDAGVSDPWHDLVVNTTVMDYKKMVHNFRPVQSRYLRMWINGATANPQINDFEVYYTQQPYKVNDAVFYKNAVDDSNVVSTLPIGLNIARVKVENYQSTKELKTKVLMALYKDNALADIKNSDTLTIAANDEHLFEIPINIPDYGYQIKVFTWDGFDSIRPLAPPTFAKGISNIVLPTFFSDGMVVQQNKEIRVWGKSFAGDVINVSFAGENSAPVTATDGNWFATLNPLQADGKSHEMVIQGTKDKVVIKNIVLGEVWYCSGQSNMAYPMSFFADARKDSKQMYNSNVRLFKAGYSGNSGSPAFNVDSFRGWSLCTPETSYEFSATAIYFGNNLASKMNVPVGLIQAAVGGSGIQWWTQRGAYNGYYLPANGGLFNPLVAPFTPLSMAGVIWYQGEANAGDPNQAAEYQLALPAMINNWRSAFKQPDLPFIEVQLPKFSSTDYTIMRDSQLKALSGMTNMAMAVTIDTGESSDIHPNGKSIVGKRLSELAQSMVYSKNIIAGGPLYTDRTINGNKIIVSFSSIGTGLTAKGGNLAGFEICGADYKFAPAQARITSDNKVEIWSDSISQPAAARYDYEKFPMNVTLYNNEGYPASPFRTYKDSDVPVPVVDKIATIQLGSTNVGQYITQNGSTVTDPNNWQYTVPVTNYNGSDCRKIPFYNGGNPPSGNVHRMCFKLDDSFMIISPSTITYDGTGKRTSPIITTGQTATIKVTYFDSGTDTILVSYNGVDNAGTARNPRYRIAPTITKTNTNTWKTVSLTVNDAIFLHELDGSGDIEIRCNSTPADTGVDDYISKVEVDLIK